MVNPEVGDEVEVENSGNADLLGSKVQSGTHESKADVGDEDEDGLVRSEDSAGGLEVADAEPAGETALGLPLLATLARAGVEEEVYLPSEKLVEDELDGLGNGGILDKLSDVHAGNAERHRRLGRSAGHKGHVEVHVASEAVVSVVRVLPAEVGDHEERVKEPASHVVELAVEREGTVTALVTENPDTGAEETLNKAVGHPSGDAEVLILNARDVGQSSPDEGADHGEVADDIVVRGDERGLEAVGGDGILDGLDVGELRLRSGLESDLKRHDVRRGPTDESLTDLAYLGQVLLNHNSGGSTLSGRHCA